MLNYIEIDECHIRMVRDGKQILSVFRYSYERETLQILADHEPPTYEPRVRAVVNFVRRTDA